MARPRRTTLTPTVAQSCQYPESDPPARPEIGAQAHFKKVNPPATCRDHHAGAASGPFPGGEHGRIAVKVIGPRGNELLACEHLRMSLTL